ncbi:MAG: YveK family protein [Acidimicrobiales bacterium]
MELRRLLVIARRRLGLVGVLILVGLAAAYLGSSRTSMYASEASIYIGQPSSSLNPTSEYGQAILAQTLAPQVTTPTLIGKAVTLLHAPRTVADVIKMTTSTVAPGSNLIRVTVKDQDPVVAQQLANEISGVFVSQTTALLPLIGAVGGPKNQAVASIAQSGAVPSAPLATNLKRNMALGGLAGLLVGIGLVLLLDYLGLSARPPRQLEELMGMSLIGVVPMQPQLERGSSVDPGTRTEDILLLKVDDA